jgi:putative ABC transport system permease protein
MNLHIRPILFVLLKNTTGTVLVTLQVAIALAVICNAVWVIHQRMERINRPTGLDDQNIFAISTASFTPRFNYEVSLREDLAYLRGLPGVIAAAPSDATPFSQVGFVRDIWNTPDHKGAFEWTNCFSMDEQGIRVLGAHLHAGRAFRQDEILPPVSERNITEFVPQMIVTQSLANRWFPGQNALGKTVFDSDGKPVTILGILDDMMGSALTGPDNADRVALIPRLPRGPGVVYLVRTQPGQRDRLLQQAQAHLAANPDRAIRWARTIEQLKTRLYLADRNMEIFLVTMSALVVLTTCVGIGGLATFNVSRRTRQIGIRRALGARKGDILLHFLIENALITTMGIVLGSVVALAVSYWLTQNYGLLPLNLAYLLACGLALLATSVLSVLYPAQRAGAVPPATATRVV